MANGEWFCSQSFSAQACKYLAPDLGDMIIMAASYTFDRDSISSEPSCFSNDESENGLYD